MFSGVLGALAPGLAKAGVEPGAVETELVREFVGKAHQRTPASIREMLKKRPELIHVSYDWGGGDFETALLASAHMGTPEVAGFLLDEGARLEIPALAMLGQLASLRVLAEADRRVIQMRGAHGIPLLSHAIAGGRAAEETARFLVESGADVNARYRNGMTPLMGAVQFGRQEMVRYLLSKGADPNLKSAKGQTALSLSRERNDSASVEALVKAGAAE